MSDHGFVPDDNNAAAEAGVAMLVVFVPFLLLTFLGLQVLGGVHFFGGGGDHAEAAAEH